MTKDEEFKRWAYESYCADMIYEWGDTVNLMTYQEFVDTQEYIFYQEI